MKQQVALALWITGWLTLLLSAAYIFEAYTQYKATGRYLPPDELINICQTAIQSGIFILSASGAVIYLKSRNPKDQ